MTEAVIKTLADEMMDWVSGRRSWVNIRAGNHFEGGHPNDADVAIMDAQEVVKRSAAIQALIAARGITDEGA